MYPNQWIQNYTPSNYTPPKKHIQTTHLKTTHLQRLHETNGNQTTQLQTFISRPPVGPLMLQHTGLFVTQNYKKPISKGSLWASGTMVTICATERYAVEWKKDGNKCCCPTKFVFSCLTPQINL